MIDPDIITGYNIYGFDFEYIYERAKKTGIEKKFSQLCRIKNQKSKFIYKELSSSALGQNKLKYYQMIGRISIDLMKVVQRDYNLDSYKLDFVASFFIREGFDPKQIIQHENTFTVKTQKTNTVAVGQYVSINYNDGLTENKFMDGSKFEIMELPDDNTLVLKGVVKDEDGVFEKPYKFYWSQAKDDVSPQEIFNFYKSGDPDKIKDVAVYCIQDCELCINLTLALDIIPNNIAMANVCSVPQSYIYFLFASNILNIFPLSGFAYNKKYV